MKIIQKKICLLGSFAVGKTSLVRQYVEGRFDDKYLSTVGVKVSRKVLPQPNHILHMLIWDLAGDKSFNRPEMGYLQGAAGALIVCDLTRIDSLATYAPYARQLRTLNHTIPLIFVANKVDLTAERMITDQMLQETCDELGGPLVLTSAKTGEQVEESFQLLAQRLA